MNLVHLFLPAFFAAGIAYALSPLVCVLARRVGALDMPGPRKMHHVPVPRVGGLAVVPAMLAAIGLLWAVQTPASWQVSADLYPGLILGLIPVFVVSLWDDFRHVGPFTKLAAQLGGAWIAVSAGLHLNETVHVFGLGVPLGHAAIPVSILWIVGVTNAFNLVDGLDGLSAGLGLISAASLAIVAVITGNPAVAMLSLVVVGALAGFIPYNLHPARVFLGDSGATAVGFTVACLTLYGGSKLSSSLAAVIPLFFVGVPVADTLVSIVRRVVRGIRQGTGIAIFQADREHIHHRLVRLGIDHRRAVLILYGAGVAMAGVGVISLFVSANNAWLLLATLVAAGVVGVGRLGYDEFAVLRGGALLRIYERPVIRSGHFKVIVDIGLALLAFYGAVALKYDDWNLGVHREMLLNGLAVLPPLSLVVFWGFGVYNRSWRFASMDDVIGVNCAVAVSAALSFVVTRVFLDPGASATLFGMCTVLLMLLTSVGRSSFRLLAHFRDSNRSAGRRVAIYGAGLRGTMALRQIRENAVHDLLPVGFIDDDPANRGRRIGGLQVLGNVFELDRVIEQHQLGGLLVASDSIPPDRMRAALHTCAAATIEVYQFHVGVHSFGEPESAARAVVRPA